MGSGISAPFLSKYRRAKLNCYFESLPEQRWQQYFISKLYHRQPRLPRRFYACLPPTQDQARNMVEYCLSCILLVLPENNFTKQAANNTTNSIYFKAWSGPVVQAHMALNRFPPVWVWPCDEIKLGQRKGRDLCCCVCVVDFFWWKRNLLILMI